MNLEEKLKKIETTRSDSMKLRIVEDNEIKTETIIEQDDIIIKLGLREGDYLFWQKENYLIKERQYCLDYDILVLYLERG